MKFGKLKLKIKPGFIALLAVAILLRKSFFLAMYIISVVLHELAHYYVAKKHFYTCTSITISIFGAVLYGDFDEAINREQVKIALAGPAASLSIAIFCIALWYIFPASYVFLLDFVNANLTTGLINLLPCYPLDGGKMFCGALSPKTGYKRALKIAKTISLVLSLVIFLVFVLSLFLKINAFSLGLFAVFLFMSSLGEVKESVYTRAYSTFAQKKYRRGMEKKTLVFAGSTTLEMAFSKLDSKYLYKIEIVNDEMSPLATYNEYDLYNLLLTQSPTTRFSDIKHP